MRRDRRGRFVCHVDPVYVRLLHLRSPADPTEDASRRGSGSRCSCLLRAAALLAHSGRRFRRGMLLDVSASYLIEARAPIGQGYRRSAEMSRGGGVVREGLHARART